MSWQGSSASSRVRSSQHASDQVQIHIDKGFDFDSEVETLRKHVGQIKKVSQAIEEESKQQGQIINSLEEAMEKASIALKRTMGRLNVVYKQAQSNHLLALVIFAIFLFIGIYVIAKIYRLGRHIIG